MSKYEYLLVYESLYIDIYKVNKICKYIRDNISLDRET